MLSKLIKHEWKATWKLPVGILIFEFIMTIAGTLVFRSPMWRNMGIYNNNDYLSFADVVGIIILISYFISLVIGAFAITIYFACRFYKNLYTDEGYLTHTLPVTPRQLILSKTLISSFWCLVSSLLTVLSVFVLLFAMFRALDLNGVIAEAIRQSGYSFADVSAAFKLHSGMSLPLFFVFMFFILIVGSISGNLIIYVCISIGQLFSKHKVAAAVISYLAVSSLFSIISSVAALPVSFNMIIKLENTSFTSPVDIMVAPMASMMPMYIAIFIITALSIFLCHFISEYIMNKKLNLD